MKREIKLIFTILFLLMTYKGMASFTKGPYLIYPGTNTKMNILWQCEQSTQAVIQWGTSLAYDNSMTNAQINNDHFFKCTLSHLKPNKKYYYCVTDNTNKFESSFFTAPKSSAKKVSFYAYGDTRSNPSTHNLIAGKILEDIQDDPKTRQSFILFTGDFNTRGNEKDWQKQWFNRDYKNLVKLYSQVPYMTCRGNHEDDAGYPVDPYRKYYPHDPDRDYYSFDYGPIHITVIQQFGDNWANIKDNDPEQYTWISNDLLKSQKPFKFVEFHAPAWSAGGHKDDEFVGMQAISSNLFVPFGVNAVINGHNHYYARCVVDGITHLTLGGGGAPLYDPDIKNNPYIKKAVKAHNYARFDVYGKYCQVTVYNTDWDSVIESFYLKSKLKK